MKRTITLPQLSFSEAFNAATSKIFQFSGRSRRSEYWWIMLITYLASIILTPLGGAILDLCTVPLTVRRLHDTGRSGWWYGICFILKAFFFFSLLFDVLKFIVNQDLINSEDVGLSLLMKYSLWFFAIAAYQVVILIFLCLDSSPGSNQYGESPKYQEVDEE